MLRNDRSRIRNTREKGRMNGKVNAVYEEALNKKVKIRMVTIEELINWSQQGL
jgi:hypothetical protein